MIRAKLDQPVRIELKAPGAAGYEWTPPEFKQNFRLIGQKVVVAKHNFGQGTKAVFELQPLAKGRFTLEFRLTRPWEDRPAAVERFTLAVE